MMLFSSLCILFLMLQSVISRAEDEESPGKITDLFGKQNEMLSSNPATADLIRKLEKVDFTKLGLSPECQKKVFTIFILKDYSKILGYLDSVGKPGSGLFLGNLNWPGSFSECHQIADSKYCLAGFRTNFMLGNATILKSDGTLGVCMPKECSADDIHQLLQLALKSEPSIAKYISFPNNTGLSKYGGDVICEKNYRSNFSPGVTATLCLCGYILFLCLIGTICELVQGCENDTLAEEDEDDTLHSQADQEMSDKTPVIAPNYHDFGDSSSNGFVKTIMDTLICFSLIKNSKAVLSTDMPKGAILSINGIRTLSILWVILGHTYSIGLTAGTLNNIVDILKLLNRFTFLPLTNGFFSVDTFFLLSGLLASYLTLRRTDKTGKLPFPMAYVHRFLRLTPAYMFVILFFVNILPMIGEGPMWNCITAEVMKKPCVNYWWTNLLYINNFYPKKLGDECLCWGWYLANDMQFFIISPFILFFMHRLKLIGTLLANGILIAISIFVTAIITAHYNLDSLEIVADVATRPTPKYSYIDYVYVKPYCRIVPYLVGMILGYILHRQMRFRGPLKWMFAMAGWTIAVICGLSVTYGTWGSVKKGGHVFTKAENAIYGSLSRLSWSIAVAWVIYACHFDLGSLVNSILGWRGFIPLSRLTYGAYLIHPMTIIVYYTSKYTTSSYSDLTVAFEYVSVSVISYAAAFILAICVEYPILNLEKKIFKRM